jgi:hypothetical protein
MIGLRVQLRLVEFVTTVRLTVPMKPPTAWTVMLLVAGLPVFAVTSVGLAVRVKSWTFTVTIVEWDSTVVVPVMEGLVPLTVTVYVPPLPVQLSVLVPDPDIVDGLRVQLRPVAGDTVAVRVTVPVKPFSGDTMMVVVPVTPGVVLIVAGLAKIWKSTTCTVIVGVL